MVQMGAFAGVPHGWNRMCMNATARSVVTGSIGTQQLGPIDLGAAFVSDDNRNFSQGMVALGGGWHEAYFDNLAIAGRQ